MLYMYHLIESLQCSARGGDSSLQRMAEAWSLSARGKGGWGVAEWIDQASANRSHGSEEEVCEKIESKIRREEYQVS